MAPAQRRMREGFGYEVAATLRGIYEMLAGFADVEAVIPLLSGYEEHSSGFFG